MPNASCVVDLVKEQQNKKRYRVPYFNDSLITVVKFTAVLKLKSSEKLMVADRCTLNLITGNRTFFAIIRTQFYEAGRFEPQILIKYVVL